MLAEDLSDSDVRNLDSFLDAKLLAAVTAHDKTSGQEEKSEDLSDLGRKVQVLDESEIQRQHEMEKMKQEEEEAEIQRKKEEEEAEEKRLKEEEDLLLKEEFFWEKEVALHKAKRQKHFDEVKAIETELKEAEEAEKRKEMAVKLGMPQESEEVAEVLSQAEEDLLMMGEAEWETEKQLSSTLQMSKELQSQLSKYLLGDPCTRWRTEEDGEDLVRMIMSLLFESVNQRVEQWSLAKELFQVRSCLRGYTHVRLKGQKLLSGNSRSSP